MRRENENAKFLNPDEIIKKLPISSGMKVAHFGCGAGYFTFSVARKVGSDGIVYALDVLEQKVEIIKSQARLERILNIVARKANLEDSGGSKIEDDSMDWVIIVNMLYENTKKNRILMEAKRILKKSGRILLIDWNDSNNLIGPEISSRISKGELIKLARKNGLGILEEIPVNDFHFGLVLAK